MTKVIVIGNNEVIRKKEISFESELESNDDVISPQFEPNNFKVIELICTNYKNGGYDLLFAYDDDRNCGILFTGHYNDGIV